ncbi:MAG: type VI secretion system contractile sheath large subunit [Nannocystis sp.]|nr:type VI secretion system contractile sheath large subunit [Nannocystis sp.]
MTATPAAPRPPPLLLLFAALPADERPAIRRALALALAAAPIASLDQLDPLIVALDRRLSAQLDPILHHPRFQALEARWRGLRYLLDNLPQGTSSKILIELLSATKDELIADLEDAPEPAHSGLHRLIYAAALGTYGGAPYALLCADFTVGPSRADTDLLRRAAAIAAVAHAPLLTNASPQLFGVHHFAELAQIPDLEVALDAPGLDHWRRLAASPAARHLAVCLPRLLLRAPYRTATDPQLRLRYDERITGDRDLLWGHAAHALLLRAAHAFARDRWCVHLLGDQTPPIPPPIAPPPPALAWPASPCPIDLLASHRVAHQLAHAGFTPLVFDRARQTITIPAAPTLAVAHGRVQLADHLPYVLLIARVAHYIKQIQREHLGLADDLGALTRALTTWLRRYTADIPDPHRDTRARRPFRRTALRLEALPDQIGWIRAHLEIEPHLTHHGAAITLALVSRLDRSPAPRAIRSSPPPRAPHV